MKRHLLLALALGSWLGGSSANAQDEPMPEPGRLATNLGQPRALDSSNQQLANQIAQQLRASAALKDYRLGVWCVNGSVELGGEVADVTQRAEAIRIALAVPGVRQIRDRLQVAGGVVPAQVDMGVPPIPRDVPEVPGQPPLQEPMSIMPVPMGPNPAYQPPPLPPYAWPTTAPYNNLSRVAYPNNYPYEAWPFIGPMYPFPKVPPGWRSVSLSWQDGYWWYSRKATGHDWWRVRYW